MRFIQVLIPVIACAAIWSGGCSGSASEPTDAPPDQVKQELESTQNAMEEYEASQKKK